VSAAQVSTATRRAGESALAANHTPMIALESSSRTPSHLGPARFRRVRRGALPAKPNTVRPSAAAAPAPAPQPSASTCGTGPSTTSARATCCGSAPAPGIPAARSTSPPNPDIVHAQARHRRLVRGRGHGIMHRLSHRPRDLGTSPAAAGPCLPPSPATCTCAAGSDTRTDRPTRGTRSTARPPTPRSSPSPDWWPHRTGG
jgi:hypothetical protein